MGPMDIANITTVTIGIIWILISIFLDLYTLRKFEGVPHIKDYESDDGVPNISIIIPSRNMGNYLGETLRGVFSQSYKGRYEVILVDDDSDDDTQDIIKEYIERPNFRYIHIDNKPADWLGKQYACYRGFINSVGEYIVFLDADTLISSYALSKIVDSMLKDDIDVMSPAPTIISKSISGKTVQIILSGITRAVYRFDKINRDESDTWLFGSLIVWKRKAYIETGTHKAVKNKLLDDVELARRARRIGLKVRMYRGHKWIYSFWYDKINDIISSLSRIVYSSVERNFIRALKNLFILILAYYTPIFIVLSGILRDNPLSLFIGILSYISVSLYHIYDTKEILNYNPLYVFLYPLGIFLLIISILNAWVRSYMGKAIRWRDRYILGGDSLYYDR